MKSGSTYQVSLEDYAVYVAANEGQGWWMRADGSTYADDANQQSFPAEEWPVLIIIRDQMWMNNFPTADDAVAYINAQLQPGMLPGCDDPITGNTDPGDWSIPNVDVKVTKR